MILLLLSMFAGMIFSFNESAGAVEYNAQDLRDPFGGVENIRVSSEASATIPSFAEPPITLDGIIWVPEKPRAVINGKRVLIGGMIGGAEVLEIRKKDIKVRYNEEEFTLKPQKGEREEET